MSIYFGLHVGQSSACLAVHRDGRLDVVANDAGDRTTPACVGINEGEVLVGVSAKQLGGRKPASVVKHNMRILSLNEKALKEAIDISGPPSCPKLVLSTTGNPEYVIEVGEGVPAKRMSATSVQTRIFKYMHDIAASHATSEVEQKNTVLTVPYYFSKKQRDVISKCAEVAGFHVVQVINEPSAACLAYSLGQLDQTESLKVVIYSCGGSSLSASVVLVNGGMISILKSITRNNEGGDKITEVLADYLAEEFKRKYKVDPRETKRGKMKLRNNAETVKHILSTLDTANCYIESLYDGIDFSFNVTRARFDNELSKVLPSLMDPIEEALKLSGTRAPDVDKVVLCGGTSKIPKFQKYLASMFPNAEVLGSLTPDEVLALGAATQASLLNEPWLDEGSNEQESEHIGTMLTATAQAILYSIVSFSDDGTEQPTTSPTILIPVGIAIPTRRSNHLTGADNKLCDGKSSKLSVKLFSKYQQDDTLDLADLTLEGLTKESKVSVSAHIHRDGSVHFVLTDKTSGQCDQISLKGPEQA